MAGLQSSWATGSDSSGLLSSKLSSGLPFPHLLGTQRGQETKDNEATVLGHAPFVSCLCKSKKTPKTGKVDGHMP